MPIRPWHAPAQDVHHICSDCEAWRYARLDHPGMAFTVQTGTGDKTLCPECALRVSTDRCGS